MLTVPAGYTNSDVLTAYVKHCRPSHYPFNSVQIDPSAYHRRRSW